MSTTLLQGVLRIKPLTNFVDHRGRYLELYNRIAYLEAGIDIDFIQDDISVSRRDVLRGIHGDEGTWKLVTCPFGSIHLIVVNNDCRSQQFKEWQSFSITEENRFQFLIPPRFGTGHLITSDTGAFHYKQSTYYASWEQFTIAWNDPTYGFDWPIENPILSLRDSANPTS